MQFCYFSSSHKVLDFGSGLGGPARFLACQTNCEVLAVELQPDLDQTALDLTTRCGLGGKLKHVCGDILKLDLEATSFDFLVNWLVILHIEDRKTLFNNCFRLLKPGGKIYSEDFYKLSDFDSSTEKSLKEDVYAPHLPSKEEYIQQMKNAGFQDIQFEDLTTAWRSFVGKRFQDFSAGKERHVRVLGQETYDALHHFYNKINELFNGSPHVGGCRIVASKI
ncbi:hypothetical protein QZH41_014627 [Actinostola sp. cb2023]|nr:hypothetical protein QZH41_014627 [Actinostola sp. cb2023]